MSMNGEADFAGWRRGGRNRVAFDCGTDSRAKQQFADECDINNLMRKYEKGIALTHLNRYQGEYADVTGAVDYHEASNIVLAAQEAFSSLPAAVRKRFDNDPGQFMDFVSKEENREELVKLGLAKAPEAPAVSQDAPPVPEVKP